MSSPYVVVAAVHEPEETVEEWWEEHRQTLDDYKEEYDDEGEIRWPMCEGEFKSAEARETYTVKPEYHSGRGEVVIEVIISGKVDIPDIRESGLEDVIEEINYRFESDFTLEVYHWYNGVDKPGGVRR